MPKSKKIKLHGFNNLSKTLSFNIYDINYAASPAQERECIRYIDEAYSATRMTEILRNVTDIIGANVLNIAHQDYDPHGASVTILISEEATAAEHLSSSESPGPLPEAVVVHIDKSHITVPTYPESHPGSGISTFRADIDVSTCGRISPLKALQLPDSLVRFRHRDHGLSGARLHPRRERKQALQRPQDQFDLDNYLFGVDADDVSPKAQRVISEKILREMAQIFPECSGEGCRSGRQEKPDGSCQPVQGIENGSGGAWSSRNRVSVPPHKQPVSSPHTLCASR